MKEQSLNRTIARIWEDKYVVPLYQRNFTWTESQTGQLLQDIFDNAPKSECDVCGNYYLGSLVVVERKDGVWEVIDGQQRLTCLQMVCRYLDIFKSPCLSYDSRPEVEQFFIELYRTPLDSWDEFINNCSRTENNKLSRLTDALETVENYRIRTGKGDETTSLKEMAPEQRQLLARYIRSNVILVRTPLPQDADVAAYFEIMNNRGEQLQPHEIVKAMLIQGLDETERCVFATIWDACSQMDLPIQQTLASYRSKGLFGEDFDTLDLDRLGRMETGQGSLREERDIEDILQDCGSAVQRSDGEQEETDIRYHAILDFPNFLMHVFRMYKDKYNASAENDVSLNADAMPTKRPEYITDSMHFIKFLLKIRTLYDRYVIKMQGRDDEDESLKWRLLRPYRYDNNLRLRNTFSATDDSDVEDDLLSMNDKVIKQQSMLQVTFRQRKYKNWLYDLLTWLDVKFDEGLPVSEDALSDRLDRWIVDYYENLRGEWEHQKKDILHAGTATPHFLLNFIDYLYWLAWKQKHYALDGEHGSYVDKIEEFQFKYYNSVEHHLPESYHVETNILDNIGNLCLISRRKNSSLNDKGPTEKAMVEPGMQPNRRIMYLMTRHDRKWDEEEINIHEQQIEKLLALRAELIRGAGTPL